jgi:hypothetical protein
MFTGRLLGHVLGALVIADAALASATPTVSARKHKNKNEPSAVATAVLAGQTFVNKVSALLSILRP